MKKQLLISLAILFLLTIVTGIVILYGRGYRIGFERGKPEISGTGLLVTKSVPNGAQVFINGHLTTATDNTINLAPGQYMIKFEKEGYFAWEKKVIVQKEVVAIADALLFPIAPKLESITATGVENPVIDPSQTRIAYTIASQSARKNGIYILDMNARQLLTFQSASTQITDDTTALFSESKFAWSPDGQELLATVSAGTPNQATYLLSTSGFNDVPQDVTATLSTVERSWELQRENLKKARFAALKPALQKTINENFNIIGWAPDETKILYTASRAAELPILLTPRLLGANTTLETRSIKEKGTYVYDVKEDRNYQIFDAPLSLPTQTEHEDVLTANYNISLKWFPDSRHLIYVHDKKIDMLEYDGLNTTTIYAGPFNESYVFAWPNWSKLVVLTNLGNPTITPNLYTIGLK